MLSDLQRFNSLGNEIGIRFFAKIVFKQGGATLSAVKSIYFYKPDAVLNVNAAVVFFKEIGMLTVANKWLYPTEMALSFGNVDSVFFWNQFCRCIISFLMDSKIVKEESYHFDIESRTYYIDQFGFPLSFSVFRNILIQLSALVEIDDGSLRISRYAEKIFLEEKNRRKTKLKLEALKKLIEEQNEQGEEGEAFALLFEKERVSRLCFENAQDVKLISDIDASAGYDMVSFERSESKKYDRFIEIKTYVGNIHFYWSRNEIEISKLLKNQYYLYLIDYSKIHQTGYVPLIIENPFENIYTSNLWEKDIDCYFVEKNGL